MSHLKKASLLVLVFVFMGIPETIFGQDAVRSFIDEKRNFKLEYPENWQLEEISEMNGILISSPISEANWQANVFLELRVDQEGRTLAQMMEDLLHNLSRMQRDFKLIRQEKFQHPNGFDAAELLYSKTHDSTSLIQQQILIPYGDGRTLFAEASSEASLWDKYKERFQAIIDSIKILTPT